MAIFLPMEILRVNQRAVVHDQVDGEVIAVNLETGTYYSLRGAAAVCWDAIVRTATEDALARLLVRRYALAEDAARADVARFADDLAREDLVVREPGRRPSAEDTVEPGERLPEPYAAPALQKYEDMRDLLLLDPIHDVDATGWPVPRSETPTER